MLEMPDYAEQLEKEFRDCLQIFHALGDETRQHLLCVMLSHPTQQRRVVELAKEANLSRPAVSHHIQILKEAGVVKARKEGTLIYYHLDPDHEAMAKVLTLLGHIQAIQNLNSSQCPQPA